MARTIVREPDFHMPVFPLGLSMGMLLSLPMVFAGLALILYARRRPATEASPAA